MPPADLSALVLSRFSIASASAVSAASTALRSSRLSGDLDSAASAAASTASARTTRGSFSPPAGPPALPPAELSPCPSPNAEWEMLEVGFPPFITTSSTPCSYMCSKNSSDSCGSSPLELRKGCTAFIGTSVRDSRRTKYVCATRSARTCCAITELPVNFTRCSSFRTFGAMVAPK